MKCPIIECPLNGKAEVPYSGSKNATLVYMGECPGYEEIKARPPKPFIGRSGQEGRGLFLAAGIPWNSLLLMNSARCLVNKKELSDREITKILACCRKHAEKVLYYVKPKLIILAGDFALRQVLKRKGITKARKEKWIWSDEFKCWCKPTFHPAYLAQNPNLKHQMIQDLREAKAFVDNGYKIPEIKLKLDYKTVETLENDLKGVSCVGIDTEGQGLDWTDPNYIVISVAVSMEKGVSRNLHLYEEVKNKSEADIVIKWPRLVGRKQEVTDVFVKKTSGFDKKIQELFSLMENSKIKKIMQHGQFDIHALNTLFRRELGKIPELAAWTVDTQAAANLLDENTYQLTDLTTLQFDFTERQDAYDSNFAKKWPKSDMLAVPYKELEFYAMSDPDVTRQAGIALAYRLAQNPRVLDYFKKFTMPTLETLVHMEENGVPIDQEEIPKISKDVYKIMMQEQNSAWKSIPKKVIAAHHEKNVKKKDGIYLTRRDFIRDILYGPDGFKTKVKKLTKGKEPSTDKNVIKDILESTDNQKLIDFILNFQKFAIYQNLHSKYFKTFGEYIKHDLCIHSSLSIARTVTGRLSSSDPNIMNFPKRNDAAPLFRRLIKAPKGYVLISADQSQSELRWMAHMSRDREMLRIYNSENADIHTETAKALAERRGEKKWENYTKEEQSVFRRSAKVINFGLLYGMTPQGLIIYAKNEYGVVIDFNEAQDWIDLFFGKYSNILIYHKEMINFCLRKGYVESVLGRRRHLPDIKSSDPGLRRRAENQAVNHPIQSPSSDAVLLACNEIRKKKVFDPEECKVVLFVHDELVFMAKDNSKVIDHAKTIKYYMEHPPLERDFGVKLRVPLVSDPKIGYNLQETKELKL